MINPSFPDADSDYYVQEKRFLYDLIPDGPNVVMDLGCGSGRVGKGLLDSNKAAKVVGVEIFPPAAKEAVKSYETVHVGDLEEFQLNYKEYFDIVVCGDILEHLKEPWKIVLQIHHWLKANGRLICCVPNIRYWRVLKDLALFGKWEYAMEGILDQTHLRFFTRRSFRKMLTDASFAIELERMRIAVGPKQETFNRVTHGLFEEFLAIQMLFSARKS